jgi:hypothetical protein
MGRRMRPAGYVLVIGLIAAGTAAAVQWWWFPNPRVVIVGTWVRDRSDVPRVGYAFTTNGRYLCGNLDGGRPAEVGEYEVWRSGTTLKLTPDVGPPRLVQIQLFGRNELNVFNPPAVDEQTYVSYWRVR